MPDINSNNGDSDAAMNESTEHRRSYSAATGRRITPAANFIDRMQGMLKVCDA